MKNLIYHLSNNWQRIEDRLEVNVYELDKGPLGTQIETHFGAARTVSWHATKGLRGEIQRLAIAAYDAARRQQEADSRRLI